VSRRSSTSSKRRTLPAWRQHFRQLAERAVEAAIDGALGELARQMGGPNPSYDRMFKEALSAGLSNADVYLRAIYNPPRRQLWNDPERQKPR
jgi:hypothetical protein